jgi:hypothetical protein
VGHALSPGGGLMATSVSNNSENSKANRIETMKGPAESGKIRLVESRKIAKEKK